MYLQLSIAPWAVLLFPTTTRARTISSTSPSLWLTGPCTLGPRMSPSTVSRLMIMVYIALYNRFGIAIVLDFCEELFNFVEDGTSQGENILIHCLAGAHRAGTCAITCLIHFANLSGPDAIARAKAARPIIDPIGTFPEFIQRVHQAHAAASSGN